MTILALMRHAKSSWSDPSTDDFDRRLNDRGQQAAIAMGVWLAQVQGLRPDLVLVSSAQRTRETWALMAPQLAKAETVVIFDRALYLASASTIERTLVEAVAENGGATEAILVLGHNPGMEEVLWDISTQVMEREAQGQPTLPEPKFHGGMPTAAVALVEGQVGTNGFEPQSWLTYATPKDITGEPNSN